MTMSLQKYDPETGEQKPSMMKKRRYPVTLVIAVILGIPSFFFVIATAAGGGDASTKFLVGGFILLAYLVIVGISFIIEGTAQGHWGDDRRW